MSGRDGRTPAEHQILRAIRKMPFGLHHIRTSGIEEAIESRRPLTIADLAEWIEAIRDRLVEAVEDVKATELQLSDRVREEEVVRQWIHRVIGRTSEDPKGSRP